MGALLDALPRLIDREDENGKVTVGVYSRHMTHIIGEGAYDAKGHKNAQFLEATKIGPFPREMQQAWARTREEVAENYGIVEGDRHDEWSKMGPMADPAPATIINRGAAERKQRRRVEAFMATARTQRQTEQTTQPQQAEHPDEREEDEDHEELREAVAQALSQAERDA